MVCTADGDVTYNHRQLRIVHPVRFEALKQLTVSVVVWLVTTREFGMLYVSLFIFVFLSILESLNAVFDKRMSFIAQKACFFEVIL